MSRDINVYSPKDAAILPNEIVTQMAQRGVPIEWRFMLSSERKKPAQWTAGYIYARSEVDQQEPLSLSRVAIKSRLRASTIQFYQAVMTEHYRAALEAAKVVYQISVPLAVDERLLVTLVDVLAEMSDGLILDTLPGRFYSLTEYRSAYAYILGRNP
jgi:hypothetical protein